MPSFEILFTGLIQGIGFRPFIYREAVKRGIVGFVSNTVSGVVVQAEGDEDRINDFIKAIKENCPSSGKVEKVYVKRISGSGYKDFKIIDSLDGKIKRTFLPVDMAVCSDCLAEMYDPSDRRYLYPFINCMHCGPRFTIVDSLPYDRKRTSMAKFSMCDSCRNEYEDPSDRRFHAEPVCCPHCGPHLQLYSKSGETIESDDPVGYVADAVKHGEIAAVKGLGGWHLVADAFNGDTVEKLRRLKNRPFKPFAVMVPDVITASHFAEVDGKVADILSSAEAPILLLPKSDDFDLPEVVCPDNLLVGVFLPYTPIQYLLFFPDSVSKADNKPRFYALIMTSGNISDEPIAIGDMEAVKKLGDIADIFLGHNREILRRADDGVRLYAGRKIIGVRSGRGSTPSYCRLREELPSVLAYGGDLKNSLCLINGDVAVLSQHVGDLENPEALDFCYDTASALCRFYGIEPVAAVCDLHPRYFSSKAAINSGRKILKVQHHHAHMAAVMAEYGIKGPVVGVIFDGTGYGSDGTIWGGEWLVGDEVSFERAGHIESFPLQGGDAAAREPWRTAVSVCTYFGLSMPDSFVESVGVSKVRAVGELVNRRIGTAFTSSMGRLFDAVASLLCIKHAASFEAEAAIALEHRAFCCKNTFKNKYEFTATKHDGKYILKFSKVLAAIVDDLAEGMSIEDIAYLFHLGIASATADITKAICKERGINKVVLGGGCFQNTILVVSLSRMLEKEGIDVFVPSRFPVNDGGLALGQAFSAASLLKKSGGI